MGASRARVAAQRLGGKSLLMNQVAPTMVDGRARTSRGESRREGSTDAERPTQPRHHTLRLARAAPPRVAAWQGPTARQPRR